MKILVIVKNCFYLASLLVLVSSCSASDPEIALGNLGEDYLVFGHFYGECGGEGCIETFALTANELYEDQNDNYFGGEYDFMLLPADNFELVKDLVDDFPTALLDETVDVFGCPDCGDWGGLRIEYVEDGKIRSWTLDLQIESNPAYLRDFIETVQEKITLINN